VTAVTTEPRSSGIKLAPQVVVLLDEESRVLNINRSLAGTGFSILAEDEQSELHGQLHPDCSGDCRFNELWKKAWSSLSSRDTIEWEVDDQQLRKLLRLNLARPPTSRGIKNDRRRRHALLTITDITKHRREYEALVEREHALVKLLNEQGVDLEDSANDDKDGTQTGERRHLADYGREYRSFSREVILAQELERKRIATELHDSIAQSLGVIKYHIEDRVEGLSRLQPELDLSSFEGVVDQIKGVVDEVRRISSNLAPSMLEDFGLCVALDWLCNEFRSDGSELQAVCEACADESNIPDIVKIAIFRVAQEALNNISKHSLAADVKIAVNMADGGLRLEISDDGIGFDFAATRDAADTGSAGLGLRNMRERVLVTGGEFSIESAPGKGVRIRATWLPADLDLMGDETVLDSVDSNR